MERTEKGEYVYDEKLITFFSPFKLHEQNLSDNNFNNKIYRSEDLGIFYIEMDAEALEKINPQDKKEEINSKFLDLSLPKMFFIQCFKQQGIEIGEDKIKIESGNNNRFMLSIRLPDGTNSFMYFVKKDYLFSTIQVIYNSNTSAEILADHVLKSVIFK